MDWQRDPKTGEWVVIDPMTQSTSQQEPNPALRDPRPSQPIDAPPPIEGDFGPTDAGYVTGDAGEYPVVLPREMPGRSAEGAPIYHGSTARPTRPDDLSANYQNYDPNAYARWAQEVEARGNEIRETAVGCFEVQAGTNNIVSRAPSGYKVN